MQLMRRTAETIEHIGLDEKSFRAVHLYVTTLNDLDEGRVLEVVETHTTEATEQLLTSLARVQCEKVKSVVIDMWKPFADAVNRLLPDADIVHDHFHVSKYLNESVDKVRRQESRNLNAIGDKTLIGSRYAWLRNPENMSEKQRSSIDELMVCELKTGIAWSLKNMFGVFWQFTCRDTASYFFNYWSKAVDCCELKPMIKVKDMLERQLQSILNYVKHRTTNTVSEGLHSKIQLIKSSTRGFHSFERYRTRILFYCGKLNMSI